MTKQKIYLDTSVLSAYFDFRKPLRQLMTERWVQNDFLAYDVFISSLVLVEIGNTPDRELREKMLKLVGTMSLTILDMTPAVVALAQKYRTKVIPKEENDSLHIAVASLSGLDAIVSWNFKHIVNLDTIHGIHQVNLRNKLGIIEILSIQNLGGDKYVG